jgi:hypothetical protein
MSTKEQDSKAMLAVPAESDPALRKLATLIYKVRLEVGNLETKAQDRLTRLERERRQLDRAMRKQQ